MNPFLLLKNWKRKDSIGLDFGMKELKWVKLKPLGRSRFRLLFLETLSLPEEEKESVDCLKEFVAKNHLQGIPTACSIQDENLVIRRLELPRMPPEDLKEAVRWQMRDIAEGSMDDYTVRSSILSEVHLPDMVRFILLGYAIKKETIFNQMRLLQKGGLKPFFIEPSAVSLASCLDRLHPTQEREWIGCVDLGWKFSQFLALENGKLNFVKSLVGISGINMMDSSSDYSTKLSMEIQHAIDALSIACQVEKIEKIFLTGGGASHETLATSLTKNLGIPTEILNPLQGLEGTGQFPKALQKPCLFGAALGLAFLEP